MTEGGCCAKLLERCAVGIVFACGALASSSFGLNAIHEDSANTAFELMAFEPGYLEDGTQRHPGRVVKSNA